MVAYLITPERVVPPKRPGYHKKRSQIIAERNDAENNERRHISKVIKHYIVIELMAGMCSAQIRKVVFGIQDFEFAFKSWGFFVTLCIGSIILYKPVPLPRK